MANCRAGEIAALLAAGSPLVFVAIKQVMRETEGKPLHASLPRIAARSFPLVATLYASEDQLAGRCAFAEKRAPVWNGR